MSEKSDDEAVEKMIWRLLNNHTARSLCREAGAILEQVWEENRRLRRRAPEGEVDGVEWVKAAELARQVVEAAERGRIRRVDDSTVWATNAREIQLARAILRRAALSPSQGE